MKIVLGLLLLYCIYAAIMVVLHPRFIYPFQPDDEGLDGFDAVELSAPDGTPIYVHEYPGAGPVLVYFMGNAGALPLFATAFDWHKVAGRHIIAMEYRGGGGRPGIPREAVLKQDAMQVMEYAARLDRPVIVQGYSMGSGLATYVAGMRDVAGVILVAPYDSMCKLMAARAFVPACVLPFVDHWHSLALARDIAAPILVTHGAADTLIPPSYSAGFEDLPNVTRTVIPEAAHADIGSFPAFDTALETFIDGLQLD